jgi:predicted Zn-dependent peptidase
MKEHLIKLENGLKVCLIPNKTVESVVVYLKGLAGSNRESASNIGVSHALEHVVLCGTKKYPKHEELINLVTVKGGKYIGVTSRDDVLFGVHTLKDNLENNIEFLAEIFYHPLISATDLFKVKKVIEAEIERYFDVPEKMITRLSYSTNFPGTRLEKFNTGDQSDIKKINVKQLQLFHKKFYTNDNFVLVVTGHFDEKSAIKYLNKYFNVRTGLAMSSDNVNQSDIKAFKLHKLGFMQDYFKLDFNGIVSNDSRKYTAQVLAKCLSSIIKNTNLSLGVYKTSVDSLSTQNYGLFSFYGSCNENVTEIILNKYLSATKLITKKLVENSKKSITTNLLFSLEKPSMVAEYYSDILLHTPDIKSFKQEIEIINEVKFKDVLEIKDIIFSQNPKLTLISNKNRNLKLTTGHLHY